MAEPLWTWAELIAATGGAADGEAAGGVNGISIDTRTLQKGDLFVALKGDNQDGHVYVTKAFEKGAGAALVSTDYVRPAGVGPLVRVDDTLKAMERLGVAARARLSLEARVIAVTGSVGKTSTKEMLRVCLESVDPHTHASEKSYNNHWGVPLTLARMPRDTKYGVFEIGMNHPGEITPLSRIVRPHVAIITTVGPVHLGFFKSVDEIADAKAEIFAGLEAPSPQPSPHRGEGAQTARLADPIVPSPLLGEGVPTSDARATTVPSPHWGEGQDEGASRGVAVLPADNEHFGRLKAAASKANIVTFGHSRDRNPDYRLVSNSHVATGVGSEVTALHGETVLRYVLRVAGEHQAMNSLAAMAAIEAAGIAPESCWIALDNLVAHAGRGQRLEFRKGLERHILIDDSYNANPVSMRAALLSLQQAFAVDKSFRRIAILGDMRELGEASDRLHRELKAPIESARIDKVFTCGPYMRALYDSLPPATRGAYAEKSTDLIAPLLAAIQPGDVIMVKGSLGTRMAPVVEALKAHLTEWEKTGG